MCNARRIALPMQQRCEFYKDCILVSLGILDDISDKWDGCNLLFRVSEEIDLPVIHKHILYPNGLVQKDFGTGLNGH